MIDLHRASRGRRHKEFRVMDVIASEAFYQSLIGVLILFSLLSAWVLYEFWNKRLVIYWQWERTTARKNGRFDKEAGEADEPGEIELRPLPPIPTQVCHAVTQTDATLHPRVPPVLAIPRRFPRMGTGESGMLLKPDVIVAFNE